RARRGSVPGQRSARALACRGLILDAAHNIVARPFKKFFNLGEHKPEDIPALPFEVYEKMDGSLGILYWHNDRPYIATRGSFSSEQAKKANELLYRDYSHTFAQLDRSKTYLFEIIYPENRIVLDYGDEEKLVLLAVTDIQSGTSCPLPDIGFPLVTRYDGIQDLAAVQAMNDDAKEGFVIRFANDMRLKIKFSEYLRLHRIVTQISSVDIWEYMQSEHSFDEILDKVPDEFYQWVKRTRARLQEQYDAIESRCRADFKEVDSRKETAMYFMTCPYPAVLFAMLNRKRYAPIIWKMIRPKFEKPFINADE
ncbi:MAG: 2'-5' RNA ligase, partial [Sphingobacteriales bacterium]